MFLAARAKPKNPGVASSPAQQAARCANAPLGHAIVLPLLSAGYVSRPPCWLLKSHGRESTRRAKPGNITQCDCTGLILQEDSGQVTRMPVSKGEGKRIHSDMGVYLTGFSRYGGL